MLFEGVTETGALFSGKRSYLPTEIHWGYTFVPITHQSHTSRTFHCVDLSRHGKRTGIVNFGPFCRRSDGITQRRKTTMRCASSPVLRHPVACLALPVCLCSSPAYAWAAAPLQPPAALTCCLPEPAGVLQQLPLGRMGSFDFGACTGSTRWSRSATWSRWCRRRFAFFLLPCNVITCLHCAVGSALLHLQHPDFLGMTPLRQQGHWKLHTCACRLCYSLHIRDPALTYVHPDHCASNVPVSWRVRRC